MSRIKTILSAQSLYDVYDAIMSVRQKSALSAIDQLFVEGKQLFNLVRDWYPAYSWEALKERTMHEQFAALDLVTFMRDDVLVKVDRGTMAYSLEARSPLLDYRIVEFGTSTPGRKY
jgi:asparagine synthase (glutamine-hydrolysing)